MISLKYIIAGALNFVVITTAVVLSIIFYSDYKESMDERVLMQLQSIKRLKRLHIERHLNEELESFIHDSLAEGLIVELSEDEINLDGLTTIYENLLDSDRKHGIIDLTPLSISGDIILMYFKRLDNELVARINKDQSIQKILMERTGMGASGETYIVGEDKRLRSKSRFLTEVKPFNIMCNTENVIRALESKSYGTGIIEDYRGEKVYSAFHKMEISGITWIILSEIDLAEVRAPFQKMKRKLYATVASVLLLSLVLSLWLASKFTKGIINVSNSLMRIAKGDYTNDTIQNDKWNSKEITELNESLNSLYLSLNVALSFAHEIGNMSFNNRGNVDLKKDPLLEALCSMQDKLEDYRKNEKQLEIKSKKLLIEGQETERNRISKDLHDGIGPLLTSIKIMLNASDVREQTKIAELIDHTISEVRRISYDLMPQSLLDFGVAKALQNWINLLKNTTHTEIIYVNDLDENKVLEKGFNIGIFRVVQEIINNGLKHANANKIMLSITQFDERISIYYKDDGKGFDVDIIKTGSGLKNIKERVEVLNGFISISSNSSGTEIEIEIPI